MKVEVLGTNRLKVFITVHDLREWNFDVDTLENNNMKMENLFWNVMETLEIQEEIDLEFRDAKVNIEAISRKAKGVIMLITRLDPNDDVVEPFVTNNIQFPNQSDLQLLEDMANGIKSYTPELNNPQDTKNTTTFVYKFKSFADIAVCFKMLNDVYCGKSSIYTADGIHYAVFSTNKSNNFVHADLIISEFGVRFNSSINTLAAYIVEHGRCVISENAVNKICELY